MLLWNWQSAIFVVSAACLATALLTEIWVRGYARHADPSIQVRVELVGPLRLLLRSPILRWMLAGCVPLVIAQYVLTTFIVLYLQEEDIGLFCRDRRCIAGCRTGKGGAGRIIFGAVASRLMTPLSTLMLLAVMAASAAFLTTTFTQSWPLALIYAVGVLFGGTAIGWNGVYLAGGCTPCAWRRGQQNHGRRWLRDFRCGGNRPGLLRRGYRNDFLSGGLCRGRCAPADQRVLVPAYPKAREGRRSVLIVPRLQGFEDDREFVVEPPHLGNLLI